MREPLSLLDDIFQSGSFERNETLENNVFTKMKNNLFQLKKKYTDISFECDSILSVVVRKKKKISKFRQFISLTLKDGSILRFVPNGTDGLEISKLVCSKRGQGRGTYLMKLFFEILNEILGFIPPLYLECTGSVDFQGAMVQSSIQSQTKFFRKFGFRVDNRKEYPSYIDMKRFTQLSVAC
jgi:hypothetical protein